MTSRRIDREQAARHLAMLDRPGIKHLFAIIPETSATKGGAVRHILGTLSAIAASLSVSCRSAKNFSASRTVRPEALSIVTPPTCTSRASRRRRVPLQSGQVK